MTTKSLLECAESARQTLNWLHDYAPTSSDAFRVRTVSDELEAFISAEEGQPTREQLVRMLSKVVIELAMSSPKNVYVVEGRDLLSKVAP